MKKKKKPVKKKKNKQHTREDILEPNQRMFCQLYYNPGEFFSNATWAYIKAYSYEVPLVPISYLTPQQKRKYNVARSAAYQLLTNINIIGEGNKILKYNFRDDFFDNQMTRTATQDKDWNAKMTAVKEYNQLKSRILKKIDLTTKGKSLDTQIVNIIKYGETKKMD